MHPAFSVIVFTVSSGAGLGLFMLLVLMDLFGLGGAMNGQQIATAGITAVVLVSAGFISSTFHLANPKNAWRAMFRWRTSWLAREGLLGVLFYPVAVAYLGGLWLNGGEHNGAINAAAVLAFALAFSTLFSTGMIYACLKTIRQWNTALTPANYLAMGLALGALLMALIRPANQFAISIAVVLLATAAILKAIYYFWIGQPAGPSINTATGFNRGRVRILDVGHTAGTFLTQEFGYQIPAGFAGLLRGVVFVLGFILPALAVGMYPALALAFAFAGIGVERWLFFAEARHVVNLYHGAQTT